MEWNEVKVSFSFLFSSPFYLLFLDTDKNLIMNSSQFVENEADFGV
jgi:hypothetical protein